MEIKNSILILHLLGVCFGLGGTLILDFRLFRLLRGDVIEPSDVLFAQVLSRFVQTGLVILWASGIAFFSFAPDGPASLMDSPKLQAKLTVVVALTLNGILIGGLAVPLIEQNVGRPIFEGLGVTRRSILVASAVISSVSWLTPFILGSTRAFSVPVSAAEILQVYAAVTAFAIIVAQVGARLLYRPSVATHHPLAVVTPLHDHQKREPPLVKS